MKKKKWLIALGIVLLLVVALLLFSPYLFPREVMTVEKIEDISQIAHLDEDDLLMTYEIVKCRRTLSWEEIQTWGYEEPEYISLSIFSNGAVYIFYTNESFYSCIENDFENTPKSAYFLGNISFKDLWAVENYLNSVNMFSEKYDYREPDPAAPEPESYVENLSSAISINSVMLDEYSKKQEDNAFYLYIEEQNGREDYTVLYNEISGFHSQTTDPHALATLDWLRGTWYFEQYIDLMYQELYPWLVE